MSATRPVVTCLTLLFMPPLAAVATPAPPATATVLVEADVDCSVRVDGRRLFRVAAARPLPITVTPGPHTIEASLGTLDHVEQQVHAAPGSSVTTRVELVPVVRRRLAHARMLSLADERAARLKAMTAAHEADTVRLDARLAEVRKAADDRAQASLLRIRAVVARIRDLDRRLNAYAAAADTQAGEARSLKARADAQNNGTAVGAVAGLLGNLAAASGSRDARRNRLRADATLRRIDRLTAMLSMASDQGFDTLADPADLKSVVRVVRKKTAGTLSISDNRIEYHDADVSAAPVAFTAACRDLSSAKADARSITVKTATVGVTLSPSSTAADAVLGDLLLACPDRDF